MLKDIKAIIFDFDGTLYDFKGLPKNLCLSSIHNILKINAVQKARKALKGKEFSTSLEYENEFFSVLKQLGKFKSSEKAKNWYNNLYMKKMVLVLSKKYTKRDGILQMVKSLKSKDIKLVIYSDYGMLKERLEAVNFTAEELSYFDHILSSEDFGCLKPAKKGFLQVAKKLDISPENCLVVGDRIDTDGQGAFDSGMKYVEIKTHKTKPDYKPNHPLYSFEDFIKEVI
jgi:HAD superfamily hydrolase (TIGR01549 family)